MQSNFKHSIIANMYKQNDMNGCKQILVLSRQSKLRKNPVHFQMKKKKKKKKKKKRVCEQITETVAP